MPDLFIHNLLENSNGRQRRAIALCAAVLCALVLLALVLRPDGNHIDRTSAKASEKLRVALYDPLFSRFDTPGTPGYLNVQLVSTLAEHIGRELHLIPTDNYATAIQHLREDHIDLVLSNNLETRVNPFPTVKSIATTDFSLLLVGLQGPWPAPARLSDLQNKTVAVVAGSGIDAVMKAHQQRWPDIELLTVRDRTSPEIMDMVMSTQVQYAVVQSNEFLMLQHVFPDLINRYELDGRFSAGWLASTEDPLFLQTIEQFVRDVKTSGRLHQLQESNHRHLWDFNFSEASLFLERVNTILPRYETDFRDAAAATNTDWRLLAAIAHQESHWDPKAISPTGVRGIMMLTRTTANELGVTDRLSATESIHGGARYFRQLLNRLPGDIANADRNWIALAAYNLGPGHVLRAQQLAANAGVDPYNWEQLREFVRLLEEGPSTVEPATPYATSVPLTNQAPETDADDKVVVTATVESQSQASAALATVAATNSIAVEPLNGRALEALRYVDNVRRYYDILIWISEHNRQADNFPPAATPDREAESLSQ